MKVLYLLLLITLCQGLPLDDAPRNVDVSVIKNQNGSWFEVRWSKVEDKDESDPILGYKVTIWEEKFGYVYEMKEDGTMVPVEFNKAPFEAFNFNFMFEIQPNGSLVKPTLNNNLLYGIFVENIKAVYKVKPDGTLEPPPTENLVMNLRPDPNNKGTEIDVPADKTEVIYKGIERKRLYEIAVQAYTAKSKGPLSKRVKIAF